MATWKLHYITLSWGQAKALYKCKADAFSLRNITWELSEAMAKGIIGPINAMCMKTSRNERAVLAEAT